MPIVWWKYCYSLAIVLNAEKFQCPLDFCLQLVYVFVVEVTHVSQFFLLWNSHCALLLRSTAENLRRSTASPELENRWGASSWNRPLISTIIIIPCKELFGFKMDQVNCILAGRLLHASSWECRTSMIRLISVLLCHYCCYRPCTGVPHRKVHTILFAVSSALIYYCALISFGVTMIMMCSAVSQFYCILYCGDLLDFI